MSLPLTSFPASELDSPDQLLAVVGGFWQNYSGNDLVKSLLYARGRLDTQIHADFLALLNSVNRFDVPVWYTDNWYPLTLSEAAIDMNASATQFVWALPEDFHDVLIIGDRLTATTTVLVAGIDFFVQDGKLWLQNNPFENDSFPKQDVITDNAVTDHTCVLWLYRSRWDRQNVYQQFGYVLGTAFHSSENYKRFVNAAYDALVEGTTIRSTQELFVAVTDVQVAESDETIVDIVTDAQGLVIVTDQHVYRYHTDSTALVAVGDEVAAGNALTDTMQFFEFNRGQVPDELTALTMDVGFLAGGYTGGLTFNNTTVALVVEEDVDGFTKVSFALDGLTADVDKFWDDTHANGIAAGTTLAMLLDQRPQPADGQPTAQALPATINPLGFLVQNVLRNNLFVVKLVAARFGPSNLGLDAFQVLRRLLSPHATCIIVVQLESSTEQITVNSW